MDRLGTRASFLTSNAYTGEPVLTQGDALLFATLSLLSLLVGGSLSYASMRPDTSTEAYELWGGRFLLGGLALLGFGMPLFR